MHIWIDPHTLERAAERGATQEEIEDVIRTGIPVPARGNRLARAKIMEFRRVWRGVYYEQKKIEVIYVVEQEVAITVTVYVYYGRWDI